MIYVNPCETPLSTDDVLLVPSYGLLNSRSEAPMPNSLVYSSPMDCVTGYDLAIQMLEHQQCAVLPRTFTVPEIAAVLDRAKNIKLGIDNLWISIGVDTNIEELFSDIRKHSISELPTLNIAVDIAHGFSIFGLKKIRELAANPKVRSIMSGSVCTSEGAYGVYMAGATHIRVGIGPGAACTTRLMTGCGFPQLSAVALCAKALANEPGITIIADGGIRHPGDAAKYLAAGANAIMLGSILSKTIQSPGWYEYQGNLWKTYRGQASAAYQLDHYGKADACPEGAESPPFEYKGETITTVLAKFERGIGSAVSYVGAATIEGLVFAKFIQVTNASQKEGMPHGC